MFEFIEAFLSLDDLSFFGVDSRQCRQNRVAPLGSIIELVELIEGLLKVPHLFVGQPEVENSLVVGRVVGQNVLKVFDSFLVVVIEISKLPEVSLDNVGK